MALLIDIRMGTNLLTASPIHIYSMRLPAALFPISIYWNGIKLL